MNKEKMETGKILPLLVELSVPAMIGMIVNAIYNIVDRIYIGHIPDNGALALTGVGVCMPIIMIITAIQLWGQKKWVNYD